MRPTPRRTWATFGQRPRNKGKSTGAMEGGSTGPGLGIGDRGRERFPPRRKYSTGETVRPVFGGFFRAKYRAMHGTTDTGHGVSYNGKVQRTPAAKRSEGPPGIAGCPRPRIGRAFAAGFHHSQSFTGGVTVSTGWQEVQIACRGWSAGHDKSRPSFNCRSSFLSGCLIKQPRAMAPVGRASQSVAKSDSLRSTAGYGRG